jgi:hypothetical protein
MLILREIRHSLGKNTSCKGKEQTRSELPSALVPVRLKEPSPVLESTERCEAFGNMLRIK